MTHHPTVLDTAAGQAVRREDLTSWRLRLGSERSAAPPKVLDRLVAGFEVQVPESVLACLVRHGVLDDVTVDGTEEDVAWAADCSWSYRTAVQRHGDDAHVRLILEGVDTVATVRVDGQEVLRTDDMFHRWVVDLGVDDSAGVWEVEVLVHPVLPVARAAEAQRPLPRADIYELPYNQVRKMACSFGWDWGPVTVTAGLWRPVVVERSLAGRLDRVLLSPGWDGQALLRGSVRADGAVARARLRVSTVGADPAVLAEVIAEVVDGEASFDAVVPGAERWDVVGHGVQVLHEVEVEAVTADGAVLDREVRRVGFRDAELRQEPDAHGRSFEMLVNGQRVWARGFNWIPADVAPERLARRHVRALVEDAVAAGATMLRVWGGGVVESEDFYDACDELGVLVWQDFSFACAAYPEDDQQVERVRREVADAVRRVGHRASLVLWCGCNENLWGHEDWGWKEALGDGPWGARLYHDVIPAVLSRLDPDRAYVPGSPFSPASGAHPNDPTQGPTHHWDTWNEVDYAAFEGKSSRFAAEFGWQAPASWPTLVDALGGEPTGASDPRLARLQKAYRGMQSLARGVAEHLPHLPEDGRGWYLATQLVQARAVRASIGRFRSVHETCSGALWWQLDDCWPALSWSVVDVAGRRKLGWWACAEVMAARTVLPTADGVVDGLTLVNDLPGQWSARGSLRVLTEGGEVLLTEELETVVPPDGHAVLRPSELPAGADVVVVDLDGRRAARWLTADGGLTHAPARVCVRLGAVEAGRAVIEVEAVDLVRDLVLLAETAPQLRESRVDRQLVLLLPGERVVFTVTGPGVAELAPDAWPELLGAGVELTVLPGAES
ncbi:hypothetical protein J4G33_12325 [Actinotalea sp. BY-33]|uniref:beta-mannosidase n=1 Tax=Actinotalea soli TaxID=2819234 RepID=A0A939RVP0_9CELL|nr:hypothetical protein [Actinotalea soli]MBO1752590.1 hypothetical protein [Actinotalea soli]